MAASEVWDIAQPGKASFERRNPLSGKPASRATAATPEDARAAADAAAAAFPAWAALGPSERRRLAPAQRSSELIGKYQRLDHQL